MGKRRKPAPAEPQAGASDERQSEFDPSDLGVPVFSDPVGEAFGGLFALTPAAGALDPDETLPRLERVAERLGKVKDCVGETRRALRLALTQCLVKQQIRAGTCKDCIDDAMRKALAVAADCCGRNKQCVEQAMFGRLTEAWEIAGRYGCKLPGEPAKASGPSAQPVEYSPELGDLGAIASVAQVAVYSPILDQFGNPYVDFGAVSAAAPAIEPLGALAGGQAALGVNLVAQAPQGAPLPPAFGVCPPGWIHGYLWDKAQATAEAAWRANGIAWRYTGEVTQQMDGGILKTLLGVCTSPPNQPTVPRPPPVGQPFPPKPAPAPAPPPTPPPPFPPACPVEPPCPEPQPKTWRAWYSPAQDDCYVTGPGVAPRSPSDDLLWEGNQKSQAERVAREYCEGGKSKPLPRPEKVPPLHGIDWCNVDICDMLDQLAPASKPFSGFSIAQIFGLVDENGAPSDKLFGSGSGLIGRAVSKLLSGLLVIPAHLAQAVIDGLLSPFACGTSADANLLAIRAVLGLAETFLGDVASDASQPWEYWARYRCPQEIPTADGARAAYLANAIDEQTLECWVRANNQCWEPWLRTLEAARSKPIPLELAHMRRRKWITAQEYDDGMRRLGYLDSTDRHRLFALTEQIPPMSEILRYMVRDVDDTNLVAYFGMDDQFDVKFGSQLKEWAEGLGITEQFARYSWRAHWSIPAPGQLYTFYHRLRNDPAFWQGRPPIEVIKEALVQQDILPFWHDAFIATSFKPLTRVDARRAFEIGAIDEPALEKAYLDQGYSDENAKTLVDFNKRNKSLKAQREKWTKLYKQGAVNRATAEARLTALGYDAQAITDALDSALAEARAESRLLCIKGIKRRMLTGEFDAIGAQAELAAQGVDPDQAGAISSGWACERAAKGKQASAAILSQWHELGLIDLGQMVERLERIGYSREDAVMVAAGILNRIDQRQTKATEAAARRAEQIKAAEERKLERSARASAQALNRLAKNRELAAKAAERRERLVMGAGADLDKKTQAGLYDSVAEVRRLVKLLQSKFGQSIDDSIEATVIAVEQLPKGSPIAALESLVKEAVAAQDDVQSDLQS